MSVHPRSFDRQKSNARGAQLKQFAQIMGHGKSCPRDMPRSTPPPAYVRGSTRRSLVPHRTERAVSELPSAYSLEEAKAPADLVWHVSAACVCGIPEHRGGAVLAAMASRRARAVSESTPTDYLTENTVPLSQLRHVISAPAHFLGGL